MSILCIGMSRTHRRQISSHILFGFGFFLVIYVLTLCSHPADAATDGFNKLFTHNRTKNSFDDPDTSFLTRLRDLTTAGKKPSLGQQPNRGSSSATNDRPIAAKLKGAANKAPQFQQNNKGSGSKNKKNKGNGNGRKPKPSSNQNPNHNYYSSSYAIPKRPVDGATVTTVFTPTVSPTRIHPLTVLKTEIKGQPGAINYGRSALDDLLGTKQEDQEGRSSEVLIGPAADTNFFKNFKDHSEEPIAEESGGPAPAYARPSDQSVSSISAPSGSAAQLGHQIKGQYSEMYPGRYNQNQGQGQSHPNHKNVNYWPQKLNSYYGDEYLNLFHPNKNRPASGYPGPQPQHQMSSFEEYGDVAAGNTNDLRKVTMIDRISTFYTDYKFLAWVGIIVLVSLAALFGLLVLYWRNPPTEVVMARENLSRRLTDPTLLIFISEALRKYGDKEKIDEKPGGTNRLKRRRPKNSSV